MKRNDDVVEGSGRAGLALVTAAALTLAACSGGSGGASSGAGGSVPVAAGPDTTLPAQPTTEPPLDPQDLTCGEDPEPGAALASVDIGDAAADDSVGGISPVEALEASGITTVPIPEGDVDVVDYSRSYTSLTPNTFYSYEQMAFAWTTTASMDDVLTDVVDTIEATYDLDFTVTRDTDGDDRIVDARLVPVDPAVTFPSFELSVSDFLYSSLASDLPDGFVHLRIYASTDRPGSLPPVTGKGPGCLDALALGADLGWTLDSWKSSRNLSGDEGTPSGDLSFRWAIGPGEIDEVADGLAGRLEDPFERLGLREYRTFQVGREGWKVFVDTTDEERELVGGFVVTF